MTLSAHIEVSWPTLDLDVELQLDRGRVLAIVGPNGAGKSTVLRALAGLVPVHRGCIAMGADVWDDPSNGSFVDPGRRHVGLVFQDHLLFRHLTVLDNVAFGPRAHGRSKNEARELALRCLERLGLSDLAELRPPHLSGGQSQRVALARALVNQPALVLMDEPLASLDVTTRRHMRTEIAHALSEYRPMTVLVTHDPDDARQLADDVIVIEAGRVVQHGPVPDLEADPASPYVAELFGVR